MEVVTEFFITLNINLLYQKNPVKFLLYAVVLVKRAAPKKGVVVTPIISDGFNVRGQIDLVYFQACSDGEYKFLMNNQDHATRFLQLRPLKFKAAATLAEELLKIFLSYGAPCILQSENGR